MTATPPYLSQTTATPPYLQDLRSDFVMVTPEIAKAMLEKRAPSQRNVRRQKVQIFAKLMKEGSGTWMVNGDSIKFDTNDHLIDGQHRLEGVVLSGVPIWTYVVYGLPPESFVTIDIGGTPRNLGDVVKTSGFDRSRDRATILTWLWRFEQGPVGITRREGAPSVLAMDLHTRWEAEINEALDAIMPVTGIQRRWIGFMRMLYVVTCRQASPDRLKLFAQKISKGSPMAVDDPVAALRNYLVAWTSNAQGAGQTMGRKTGMFGPSRPPVYMIKCWNAFLAGRRYRVLRLSANEKWQTPQFIHADFVSAWKNPGIAPRGKG